MSILLKQATMVITGVCKLLYPNVSKPKAINDGEPKYYACALIDKDDTETVARLEQGIQAAYETGGEKLKGNVVNVPPLEAIRIPLQDGDNKTDRSEFAGHWYINASSHEAPEVIGLDLKEITDPSEIYSGVFVRVALRFYPYNRGGNCGIGCSLECIQKVRDGERLSNRRRAADIFNGSLSGVGGNGGDAPPWERHALPEGVDEF